MTKKTRVTLSLLFMIAAAGLVWRQSTKVPLAISNALPIPTEPQLTPIPPAAQFSPPPAASKALDTGGASPAGPLTSTTAQQIKSISLSEQVSLIFDDALTTLNLTASELAQTKRYLLERWEVGSDAIAIINATPGSTPKDRVNAWQAAEAMLDAEYKQQLGEDIFGRVKIFVEYAKELWNVNIAYGPRFAAAGAPLSAEQKVVLASVFHEIYVPVDVRHDALDLRTKDVDQSGLSELDRELIGKTADRLEPAQVDILKRFLAERTASMLRTMAQTKIDGDGF